MTSHRQRRGFTLIEVLVSVFLLSVLSAFAYETLIYVRRSKDATSLAFERARALQLAIHTLVTDFEQTEPRPVRDAVGNGVVPAFLADPRTTNLVAFTRGGWTNAAGLPRGTLQRVTYRLENDVLVREYTTVLDPTLSNVPQRRELLKNVKTITIRYMDPSHVWQTQWPAQNRINAASQPLRDRPIGVEITIELRDFGKIVRLVEVPG